jgi:hypothetical protein
MFIILFINEHLKRSKVHRVRECRLNYCRTILGNFFYSLFSIDISVRPQILLCWRMLRLNPGLLLSNKYALIVRDANHKVSYYPH